MWKYIRLKASTFYSYEEATRRQRFLFTFPYYETQIQSRGISSRKQTIGKLQIITKLTFFLEGNPAEHQYLKVHYCRVENLPICLCSYKNNTLKISYS